MRKGQVHVTGIMTSGTTAVGLLDTHGRVATDLRVSLTDRCNLRCTYCMPEEGLAWLPKPELLTDGEPLLRRGLTDIVARTAALTPRPEISLTTNGIGLARLAGPLADAGLDRVNVSLDTIRAETFQRIARRDRMDDVIAGLVAAAGAGLTPVKVNAVLMRGVNDDQAVELLEFCLERGYELRFIEQMPLDAQHGWDRRTTVTADETLGRLAERFALEP